VIALGVDKREVRTRPDRPTGRSLVRLGRG
jgi:hypothetical protein